MLLLCFRGFIILRAMGKSGPENKLWFSIDEFLVSSEQARLQTCRTRAIFNMHESQWWLFTKSRSIKLSAYIWYLHLSCIYATWQQQHCVTTVLLHCLGQCFPTFCCSRTYYKCFHCSWNAM